jgi:hypothetical protein
MVWTINLTAAYKRLEDLETCLRVLARFVYRIWDAQTLQLIAVCEGAWRGCWIGVQPVAGWVMDLPGTCTPESAESRVTVCSSIPQHDGIARFHVFSIGVAIADAIAVAIGVTLTIEAPWSRLRRRCQALKGASMHPRTPRGIRTQRRSKAPKVTPTRRRKQHHRGESSLSSGPVEHGIMSAHHLHKLYLSSGHTHADVSVELVRRRRLTTLGAMSDGGRCR